MLQLLNIHQSWIPFFNSLKTQSFYENLETKVKNVYQKEPCYPAKEDIFRIFRLVALHDVKIIIIGQDPYHGPHQADGIAFSMRAETKILAPSLRNIFKELKSDVGIDHFDNPSLAGWVKQGVLLINTYWTVSADKSASHRDFGWAEFTKYLIQYINQDHTVLFILWGRHAQKIATAANIDLNECLIAGHPSPFSFYLFNKCRHFSKSNLYLSKKGDFPINWRL